MESKVVLRWNAVYIDHGALKERKAALGCCRVYIDERGGLKEKSRLGDRGGKVRTLRCTRVSQKADMGALVVEAHQQTDHQPSGNSRR